MAAGSNCVTELGTSASMAVTVLPLMRITSTPFGTRGRDGGFLLAGSPRRSHPRIAIQNRIRTACCGPARRARRLNALAGSPDASACAQAPRGIPPMPASRKTAIAIASMGARAVHRADSMRIGGREGWAPGMAAPAMVTLGLSRSQRSHKGSLDLQFQRGALERAFEKKPDGTSDATFHTTPRRPARSPVLRRHEGTRAPSDAPKRGSPEPMTEHERQGRSAVFVCGAACRTGDSATSSRARARCRRKAQRGRRSLGSGAGHLEWHRRLYGRGGDHSKFQNGTTEVRPPTTGRQTMVAPLIGGDLGPDDPGLLVAARQAALLRSRRRCLELRQSEQDIAKEGSPKKLDTENPPSDANLIDGQGSPWASS